jgi:DNA polymerase-4
MYAIKYLGVRNSQMRKIIHIDMDAFFASVEQRDNPDLRGKPVAVGSGGSRGVVAAASYEARTYGVFSAMSSKIAKAKCPELIFVPPRFSVYKTVSLVIRSIFRDYTDLVEPLSLDEAYLDVTTNKKNLSSATAIALEIKERIKFQTDLTASAGISINKFLAKVASDVNKPDGLFVIPPAKVDAFIGSLPVEKFFGVGKVTAAKMKQHGIHTGGELRNRTKQELVSLFGKAGNYFYDVSQGRDNRAVIPHRERKSLGAEHTFEADLGSLEEAKDKLEALAQEVARRLAKSKKLGKTITLKIKFADFSQITRSRTLVQPIIGFEQIQSLALDIFSETFKEGMQIRLLGITMSSFNTEEQTEQQLTLKFE